MPSSSTPLTRQVANAIGEACAAKKVQPYDLTYAVFKAWLRDEKGLDRDELRAIQAHLSSIGGFVAVRNAFFVGSPTPATLERVEIQGMAKLGRANVLALSNDQLFMSRFEEVMQKLLKDHGRYRPFGFSVKPPPREKTQRVVTLMLSDLHFGSKLDPRELPYKYDFEEEARALASVILRTCEFKVDYRGETELVVWIGGDIIRGKIHDREGGRHIAEQGADAMWLLKQAIRILAGRFKRVTVYCSSGNHDREEGTNEGTAYDAKWNSRATLIYFGVKLAVADLPNVVVHIPRTPFCEWEAFDHRYYATHGDTNLKTGNPAKSVNISFIDKQMKTINLSEVSRGKRPYEAFLAGHIHQGMHLPLPVAELVTNPALIPPDGFGSGVGYPSTKSGQVLFESTPKRVVGDLRFLFVEPETLKDAALDKVITPFRDF